jgi:rhomboid protease GluP
MNLSPRLKWKLQRYRQKMDERVEGAREFFHTVASRQRMCPACRALVDRKEKVCPLCGEQMSRPASRGFQRSFSSSASEQAGYTIILLTVNVALFAVTMILSLREMGSDFAAQALLGSIDSRTLVRLGAKWGPLISMGEWWRLVTAMFLHGGLLHIGMNSWVLYDLGPSVEALYGRAKFLVLYIFTGVSGFVASYLISPNSISIGASGAIFGLIGAMITYGYRNRRSVGDSARNMYVRWAVYGLVFGFLVPGLDNAAHIGGLIGGIAFGWFVSDTPSFTSGSIRLWKALQAVVVFLVLFSFLKAALWTPFF